MAKPVSAPPGPVVSVNVTLDAVAMTIVSGSPLSDICTRAGPPDSTVTVVVLTEFRQHVVTRGQLQRPGLADQPNLNRPQACTGDGHPDSLPRIRIANRHFEATAGQDDSCRRPAQGCIGEGVVGGVQRQGIDVVRDAVVVVVGVEAVDLPSPSASASLSSTPSLRSLSTPSQISGVDAALSGFEPRRLPGGVPAERTSTGLATPSPSSSTLLPIPAGDPTSIPSTASNAPLTPARYLRWRARRRRGGAAEPSALSNVTPVVDAPKLTPVSRRPARRR